MIHRTGVPGREWTWGDATCAHGVHTFEGQLVWWTRPHGPHGHFGEAATCQPFDAFLTDGPPVEAPAEVVAALGHLLREASNPGVGEIAAPRDEGDRPVKFTCAVETATLVVFDPKLFAHRLSEPVEWWCERPVMVEEMSAGNGAFLTLGEDGVYEVEIVSTRAPRSRKPVSALIRNVSGEFFIGAGEDLWAALRDRKVDGRFVSYPPGVYRVTMWAPDRDKKGVACHLNPVARFRRNPIGKNGLWLAEEFWD